MENAINKNRIHNYTTQTGMSIVTLSEYSARYIIDDVNRIGVNIPKPVVVTKLTNDRDYYRGVRYLNGVLVDDVDLILQYLLDLGCPVNTATLTPDSMRGEGEMPKKKHRERS